jgi:hypothetical protein
MVVAIFSGTKPPVHDRLQHADGRLHGPGQRDFGAGRLPAAAIPPIQPLTFVVLRPLLLLVSRLRPFRRSSMLRHPWLSRWVCFATITIAESRFFVKTNLLPLRHEFA